MRKNVYFPDDRATKILMHAVKDEQRAFRKSFSKIILEALNEHVDKHRVYVQAKLTEYDIDFLSKIEVLHSEWVHPNHKRYRTWRECLEGENFLSQPAIEYSAKRGWKAAED